MYQLEVTIVTGGKNYVIDSLVVVQEPITGLVLRGPQVIELERLNRHTISMEGIWMSLIRDYLWEADTKTGTNIVYTWYLGFGGHIKTTLNKYMKGFESPGVHTVEILAQNEISKMSASLTVFVQYPIIDVTASVKKVALGMMTPINITVDGGKQFFVYIDFGDGTTFNVSSDEESYTSKTESLGHSIQVPEYLVILSHKYPDVGIYNISINVSNYVSYDVTSKMAVVGEPITGVQLHTENGSVVHVTRKVVVMATVTTGKDLRFEWDFGDRVPPIVDRKRIYNLALVESFRFLGVKLLELLVFLEFSCLSSPIYVVS
ncbi:hypothetical protein KUTeg_008383 [Tegillarca granosa]|uniref:PKD domain-containing protein n=1 Tax=Tegillarca granosa TaxID=220873 RepID=A0ABQ9F908_TEGGR|nr:hypothetical protein KUTeg_008383 [Tegillarca granosa]